MSAAIDFAALRKGFSVDVAGGGQAKLWALRGVTLSARPGETIGIVGESGCGKSTMARVLCGLEQPDAGQVRLAGQDVLSLTGNRRRIEMRRIQMVFQDPYGSLNPRHTIGRIVSEPWIGFPDLVPRSQRAARVGELLKMVGLSPALASARPGQLSGGQRQRVGIARAIAARPEVLIADEAVSALDVSVQAQVVNLLSDLVRELDLCLLFVAHDLRVVKNIADRVAVMYLGRIVETGTTQEVFSHPRHPYTRALLSAVPSTRPWRAEGAKRHPLGGEVPSPIDIPGGCGFRTRCWRALDVCGRVDPGLHGEGDSGPVSHDDEARPDDARQMFACHNPEPRLGEPS